MSKGSKKRPGNKEKFSKNYDSIFGKKVRDVKLTDKDLEPLATKWARQQLERSLGPVGKK
tara:strand:+ start:113149 stop:113328 length:180 start_codon:yes stop_codon:yes gene_type:complete